MYSDGGIIENIKLLTLVDPTIGSNISKRNFVHKNVRFILLLKNGIDYFDLEFLCSSLISNILGISQRYDSFPLRFNENLSYICVAHDILDIRILIYVFTPILISYIHNDILLAFSPFYYISY